jgi:SAM-dependent methyltransferase
MNSTNDQQRLYSDLAWLWPVISPPEDYIEEALQFASIIREFSRIHARTVLHLGCGGGHIDHTLRQYFCITGVDLSPHMLVLARSLNPDVEYRLGDMRSINYAERFDAVIVADSIDYMLNEDDLKAVFQVAFEHLNPGGVFCTYSEETIERFENNQTYSSVHEAGDLQVTLIENRYDPDPADSTYEMVFVYLIRESGKLSIQTDRHIGGMFPAATWSKLLQQTGFEMHLREFEWTQAPFWIGVKL